MGLLAPCGERARIAGAATAEADCTELSDLGIRRFVPIRASRAMSRSLPARASSEPGGTLPLQSRRCVGLTQEWKPKPAQ